MRPRSLIVGYGNPYRRDDGVAFYILNGVRRRLGLAELERDDDGEDGLGHPVDSLLLRQLVPELVGLLEDYQRVVFLDAHAGVIPEEVRVVPVREDLSPQAVSHHMSPGMVLALAREATGRAPEAYLVSVKGTDFDFGTELSAECARRADAALETVMGLLEAPLSHA